MFSTNALLDEAGIVHAGAGRNLDEAAASVFLEVPQGRVALVGISILRGCSITSQRITFASFKTSAESVCPSVFNL